MLKLLNLTLFFVNALDNFLVFNYLRLNLYYNYKTTKTMKTTKKQWQNQFCTITKLDKSYLLESKTNKYQPIEAKNLTLLFTKYVTFDHNTRLNIYNFFN